MGEPEIKSAEPETKKAEPETAEHKVRNSTGALLVLLFLVYVLGGLLWRPRLLNAHAENYRAAITNEAAVSVLAPGLNNTAPMRVNNEFVTRYENLQHSNFLTAFYHAYQLWNYGR